MEFSGTLLSDDSIRVANPKFGSDYCKEFRMFKAQAVVPESPLPFDTKGFQYQPFMTMIMQGDFFALGLSADDSRFNELFGAYLYAYAEQCAADPKTRPADFVEMTNLQCVEKGVTKTYYRNGTFSESAPYCTQWKDVPSGYFADPQLWEVKKTLDQRFLDDTYKYMFAAIMGSDPALSRSQAWRLQENCRSRGPTSSRDANSHRAEWLRRPRTDALPGELALVWAEYALWNTSERESRAGCADSTAWCQI